jgi:hypothetical protein
MTFAHFVRSQLSDARQRGGVGRLTGFARAVLSASGNNGTTLDTVTS